MEIEAESEEEAIRKARVFLGLNPNFERALDLAGEASELFQRCADISPEGTDISYFIAAAACIKQIINEAPREITNPHNTDNVIQFSEIYRRPR